MNISPNEAEEALADIQKMTQRTRRSINSSGVSITLIVTGGVWLVGYIGTQFLSLQLAAIVWIGMSILGGAVATVLGIRRSRQVRIPSLAATAKQAGIFWLLLVLFGIAAIAIARPSDGKQMTMLIFLFIMIGQAAMGLLLTFASVWWVLPITALALIGYFLLPEFFYLWMAILVGGGMIVLGVYIHRRW